VNIKHKILKELYYVQLLDKRANISLIDVSMNLDTLRKKVKTKEVNFHGSLEVLESNDEIYVSWRDNIATITKTGIVSLENKKYHKEHVKQRREKILFVTKLIGFISVILGIIYGIIRIIEYFNK